MSDDQAESGSSPEQIEKQSREQSTIQFPYGDLEDAISVATALLSCGGVPCDPDQLAAAMKQSPSSGNFRMKIATARLFGVIDTMQGKYSLTDLGFSITDPSRAKAAKADAFLNVPLYKRVYDEFRNKQLPPRPTGLERSFIGFGVAQKQSDRARHAFDRSAQQAGYFDQGGRDRLVRPTVGTTVTAQIAEATESTGANDGMKPPADPVSKNGNSTNDLGVNAGYHPFIEGLLKTLPAPNTVWAIEGRAAWLEAAASVFKLLYKGEGRISVQVAQPELNQITSSERNMVV